MIQEITALGAAYLAELSARAYPEPAKFADNWRLQRRFKAAMSAATRERKLAGWVRTVKGLLASDEGGIRSADSFLCSNLPRPIAAGTRLWKAHKGR
jgi:glycerol kinase